MDFQLLFDDVPGMPDTYQPFQSFLHIMPFLSFVGLSRGQSVGGWLSTTYGGWITAEAAGAYGLFVVCLICLIWLIDRLGKASVVDASSAPATR